MWVLCVPPIMGLGGLVGGGGGEEEEKLPRQGRRLRGIQVMTPEARVCIQKKSQESRYHLAVDWAWKVPFQKLLDSIQC